MAGREHALSEGTHKRVCLQMKLAKHFVRAPSTNETNDVGIDPSTEKCHSAARSETAGGDALRVDAKRGVEGSGAEA